jgi:DeoR family fructose operon transcriptional repressor
MKKIETRKNQLIALLENSDELSVSDVADYFNISLPTARRLCARMENEKHAIRTHGGIKSFPTPEIPYSFDLKESEYNMEKEAIAKKAVEFIRENESVYLESGTTVKQLAIALASRIQRGELNGIIVFTNSLENLEILRHLCKVFVIGGLYRPQRRDFCGFLAEKQVETLHFDICFIGADALNLENGAMAMDIETVRIDEILIKHSSRSILVADSEKFLKHSMISFCSVKDVSMIITDSKLLQNIRREYAAREVNLLCV